MPAPTLSLVVPAYNEAESLPEFLPKLLTCCENNGWQLIVVNDGSTDGTAQVLAQHESNPRLKVVRHKVNRGYGGALKSGVRAASTGFVMTVDADGQHVLSDLESLFAALLETEADMVVGSRKGRRGSGWYRELGKWIIRRLARVLVVDASRIHDLNSGLKVYDTELAKESLHLCPNSMAYSDVITLVFLNQRHRVLERPIQIRERIAGTSTISTRTAIETVREIVNIVVLFNPMRLFLPVSFMSLLVGLTWAIPFALRGNGVSVGALLAIVTGLIFFFLGLLTEQVSMIRKTVRPLPVRQTDARVSSSHLPRSEAREPSSPHSLKNAPTPPS